MLARKTPASQLKAKLDDGKKDDNLSGDPCGRRAEAWPPSLAFTRSWASPADFMSITALFKHGGDDSNIVGQRL